MSSNECPRWEELFTPINGCFELVTNIDDFITSTNIDPKEYVLDFVLQYYYYINSKPETSIPFRNYLQFISMLPIIESKSGNIYKCNSCQFYTIFSPLSRTKYITSPLSGFYLSSNYRDIITNYIDNYNKSNHIGENTEENQVNQFLLEHQKYAHNICHELEITRYNAFNIEFHDLYVRETSLLSPLPQIKDKLLQLQNYLLLISKRFSFKNQPITSHDIITAIDYTKLYLHSYSFKPFALYYTICASFLVLILNRLYNKYVLSEFMTKKSPSFRYPKFPLRIIGNIFGTTIDSLQHNIPLIIRNILSKPTEFFTGSELYEQ